MTVEHGKFISRTRRGEGTTSDSTDDLSLGHRRPPAGQHRAPGVRARHDDAGRPAALQPPFRRQPPGDRRDCHGGRRRHRLHRELRPAGAGREAPRTVAVRLQPLPDATDPDRFVRLPAPRESDAEFFRGLTHRSTRIRLRASAIAVTLLRQGDLRQRRVTPRRSASGGSSWTPWPTSAPPRRSGRGACTGRRVSPDSSGPWAPTRSSSRPARSATPSSGRSDRNRRR